MFSAIIIAAGKSTRFKSCKSKVLHKIGGLPIISHVLKNASDAGCDRIFAVTNGDSDVASECYKYSATVVVQDTPIGNADAVRRVDLGSIKSKYTVILCGDMPFISAESITKAVEKAESIGASCVVMAYKEREDNDYGRLALDENGCVTGVVEKATRGDSVPSNLCNCGIMVKTSDLVENISKITRNEARGEYYITDIVEILYNQGAGTAYITTPKSESIGINTRVDLALAEGVFQDTARKRAMEGGVTLLDPWTTYFSYDTRLDRDVEVHNNVTFQLGVVVEGGARILPNTVLEGCVVKSGAVIGPFARIRPGSIIESDAKIGNFVEIKNSTIHTGAKVNHLSYIGDAEVGEKTNIGAGTITCNYDGFRKYRTNIGGGVLVGSNTSLVAPVNVGDGVVIGAGSVVTKDILEDELFVERAEPKRIPGGAKKYREKKCVE